MTTHSSTDNTKSKKNKSLIKTNQSKLWNTFECEVKTKTSLECLYNNTISNREMCERCNFILAFSEEGFLTCTNTKCGIIYKDLLDQSPEWRFYGADDNQNSDPTRCGMPINPLLEQSSFGCKVLSCGSSSYEMRKFRQYTEWQSMPYKEKARYEEFQRITNMASHAGIPKIIVDYAIIYHKKILDYEQTFRGDNKDGLIAASIYIACRINDNPRTAKEIATIFNLDVTSATQGCKNAQVILNHIEQDMDNNEKTLFCKTKPEAFIERYCSRLQINSELTKLCHFIAIKIANNNLMLENTPHSIASGIIYFVSHVFKLNINKKDIKQISEISEVTINKCFKKLLSQIDDLIPQVMLAKYNLT